MPIRLAHPGDSSLGRHQVGLHRTGLYELFQQEGQTMAHATSANDQVNEVKRDGGTGVPATSSYQRPHLEVVGRVTELVQSGPSGNRYETYQGSYWSDR